MTTESLFPPPFRLQPLKIPELRNLSPGASRIAAGGLDGGP